MSIPASEYVDDAGRRWAVDDFAQIDSEVALVPPGDTGAKGRVFIAADEMRVYFFQPDDVRTLSEECLAVQLRSAVR